MSLKRKVCSDCGRKQGTHGQWSNNQKLCAAHTGASDALLACLTSTVALLRCENRGLRQQISVLIDLAEEVAGAVGRATKQVMEMMKP
jgi:hypothetical protein